jgi:hypothetical protein
LKADFTNFTLALFIGGRSQLRTPSVAERAMKLLRELASRYPQPGQIFDFHFPAAGSTDPSWIAVTWSESIQEVEYLLIEYLHSTLRAVDGNADGSVGDEFLLDGRISPRGHELLDKEREENPGSSIGFCAMCFLTS